MKNLLPLFLSLTATLFVSCEPMDAVDPFGLVHDDDEKSESGGQSQPISGVWKGRSATSQVSTTLFLSDEGGSISGSRSGSSVTLHIGGGDTWHLTCSGNSMSGTGNKAGGGTYNLSFTKQ